MSEKKIGQVDVKKIKEILPHRYPFLLVDRVDHIDLEKSCIVGIKNVSINEAFFQGHFPTLPIMPGVLVLEALAQVGGILIHYKGFQGKIALLTSIQDAKFRHPVVPGDQLKLYAEEIFFSSKGGRVQAKAMVQDILVAEATISYVLSNQG